MSNEAKTGKTLTVNFEVGKDLALATSDLYDSIEAFEPLVNQVSGQGFDDAMFGGLGSGNRLAGKFFNAGRDYTGIIKDHKSILESLMNTFIAAGHLYKDNDETGKEAFDRIRKENPRDRGDAPDKTALPDWSKPAGSNPAAPPALPTDLNKFATQNPGTKGHDWTPVKPEGGNEISLETYNDMKTKLTSGAQNIANLGGLWKHMGKQLAIDAKIFTETVNQKLENGMWNTPAAHKANTAIKGYVQNVNELSGRMNLIASNLEHTSGRLSIFGANLPEPLSQTAVPEDRKTARNNAITAFNNQYVPAVNAASNAIPVLPDPVPPTTQDPGSRPGPGSKQTSPQPSPGPGPQHKPQQPSNPSTPSEPSQPSPSQPSQPSTPSHPSQPSPSQPSQPSTPSQPSKPSGDDLSKALQNAQNALKNGIDPTTGLPLTPAQKAALEKATHGKGAGPGGKGGPGGAGGGGAPLKDAATQAASKLFPRASAATAGMTGLGRAGLAAAGQPGTPGGMGPAGQGGQQGGGSKEHKRADYLDSTEHLDEALGDAPVVAKPVVER
ncbi:hypothetical protein AB0H76_37110 [Nocardia sp. NPDC050712]|uniref:hypothetical protein n=1 Tax=Nocardia sp. NPDC050712 TaxID=3155518 RepID=UPI0033C8036A